MSSSELWSPQPDATQLAERLLDDLVLRSSWLTQFERRLLAETATRLFDWVDHLAVPAELNVDGASLESELQRLGFVAKELGDQRLWQHPLALLPGIELSKEAFRVVLKVDRVTDFLVAHRMTETCVEAPSWAWRRQALIDTSSSVETWVVERRGDPGWHAAPQEPKDLRLWLDWSDRVDRRDRGGLDWQRGFEEAEKLIDEGIAEFGVDPVCARFFEGERKYWQAKNRAGQVQKLRQDRLGMGWANHDHHTYRSSRVAFKPLIQLLMKLGFQRRERFYAGRDAGWGAQVLEQPAALITIFADVDLSAEEIKGDFALGGLEPSNRLGTVGLWCALHGEAFLSAGMHHLECQFDYDQARKQLDELGVASMPPFTNFDYLRQCFTEGERWEVSKARLERLVTLNLITPEQAVRFEQEGAIGSHLEILERNDGFKGFNQTGISDIILRTDPRTIAPL